LTSGEPLRFVRTTLELDGSGTFVGMTLQMTVENVEASRAIASVSGATERCPSAALGSFVSTR
jgi:hypothetical protein